MLKQLSMVRILYAIAILCSTTACNKWFDKDTRTFVINGHMYKEGSTEPLEDCTLTFTGVDKKVFSQARNRYDMGYATTDASGYFEWSYVEFIPRRRITGRDVDFIECRVRPFPLRNPIELPWHVDTTIVIHATGSDVVLSVSALGPVSDTVFIWFPTALLYEDGITSTRTGFDFSKTLVLTPDCFMDGDCTSEFTLQNLKGNVRVNYGIGWEDFRRSQERFIDESIPDDYNEDSIFLQGFPATDHVELVLR